MRSRIITPGGGLVDPYGRLLSRSGGLLREKYGGAAVVPVPLLTLDFSSAPAQSFSTANATSEWIFEDASGGITDQVASNNLTTTASPIYQAPAYGIGADMTAELALEFDGTASQRAYVNSTTFMDSDSSTSVAYRIVFRIGQKPSSELNLVDRRQADLRGYMLNVLSTGHIKAYVNDLTTLVSVTISADHCDGAWHYADVVIDRTADTLRVRTDLGSGSASIAAVGDLQTTGAYFSFGDGFYVGAPPDYWQLTYAAAIDGGSAAEALDSESFWTHTTEPTGLLSSYARSSVIVSQVSDRAHATFAPNVYAPWWSSAYRGASQLGIAAFPAATNLLQYSRNMGTSPWAATNASAVEDHAAGIDGFKRATRIAATAANGYASQSITTSSSTDYVASVYLKEETGYAGATGRVVVHDGTSEVASAYFVTYEDWQRVEVPFNHAGTTTEIRIEIDTNLDRIQADFAQIEAGTVASPPIFTQGATATRAATNVSVSTLVSNGYVDHAQGEIETLAAPWQDSVSVYLLDAKGAGAGDQKEVYIDANQQPVFDVADSSGTAAQSCGGASAAIVEGSELFRGRYDAASGVDGNSENADLVVDGIRDAGTASTWTSGSTEQTLYLGRDASSAGYLSGSIQHIKIWGSPQAEGSFGWDKFDDDFDGTSGNLLNDNWQHFQPNRVPQVEEVSGRYRAEVHRNWNDETLWYGSSQGRFDYKRLTFPFEVIAYNIGIGTTSDSQTPPGWDAGGATWFFCGLMVHVDDLATVSYQASLCGHRGTTHHTIEQKNTLAGSSSVADEGIDAVPDGRADLRVVGSGGTLSWYWRLPGDTSWTASSHTAFSIPTYGTTVKVGIVTYAYLGYGGLPFVGTCDSIVLV